MIRLLAIAVAACLVTPAFADPPCVATADLLAKLKADGDTIAADFPVPGQKHIDRIIIDLDGNGSWLWASKGDCVVGNPVGLDDPAGMPDAHPAPKPASEDMGA